MDKNIASLLKWTFCIALVVVVGVKGCRGSDWYKDGQAKVDAQDAADAVPKVFQEVDGCKVYVFKSGNWHYFTRCPSTTTTDTTTTYNSGKTTQTEISTITTVNQ